jgi:hypothetical protein
MAGQGTVKDSAPTKHSVRVDWFQRDPGGSTIFVMPGDDGAAAQSVADHSNDTEAVDD